MSVKVLNSENFQTETQSWVVVVDFWAEWCGPCQQMLPILDQYSQQAAEGVVVAKVNVDEAPWIAQQFRVMSIPTIIVLKNWQLVDSKVWVQSIDSLNEMVAKHI